MGLPKGRSNNLAGKPKGAKNKVNAELRERISDFLNGEFDSIQADFKKLEPKERLKFYTDLLQYGLPKLQATSFDIDLESLSDDQLDQILKEIKTHITNEGIVQRVKTTHITFDD